MSNMFGEKYVKYIKVTHRSRSGVFSVNFNHILQLVLVFLLLTLTMSVCIWVIQNRSKDCHFHRLFKSEFKKIQRFMSQVGQIFSIFVKKGENFQN